MAKKTDKTCFLLGGCVDDLLVSWSYPKYPASWPGIQPSTQRLQGQSPQWRGNDSEFQDGLGMERNPPKGLLRKLFRGAWKNTYKMTSYLEDWGCKQLIARLKSCKRHLCEDTWGLVFGLGLKAGQGWLLTGSWPTVIMGFFSSQWETQLLYLVKTTSCWFFVSNFNTHNMYILNSVQRSKEWLSNVWEVWEVISFFG